MRRDVERECRLAHRGACGDEDEIGLLQTCRQMVKLREARRQSRDAALVVVAQIDLLQGVEKDVLQRHEVLAALARSDLEDALFRAVHDVLDFVGALVGGARDLRRSRDQRAKLRLLMHDTRVVMHVRRRRHGVRDQGQRGDAADLRELVRLLELLGQGHEVDRLRALLEFHHGLEDQPMRLAVEVVRRQFLGGGRHGVGL